MSERRFSVGDVVVVREILQGRLWTSRPVRVVADRAELLALFLGVGTTVMCPIGPSGAFDRTAIRGDYRFEARSWQHTNVLILAMPDEPWSTRLMWNASTGDHVCWYVNIEEPLRRTPCGFDTMDDELDIVVQPDRTWTWKDEDKLRHWVDAGLYDRSDVARIESAAARAKQAVERWASPLCDGWERWRPPANWSKPPPLPSNWRDR